MSDVPVVIATRNRSSELARTLRNLTSSRPAPPIVVVDNASDDDTAQVARSFKGVRVIRSARNAAAAGRNLGVAAADTPYVAFSDDDSWWAPGALTKAAQIMDAHPQIGLLAARTLVGPQEKDDPVNALMADSPLGRDPGLPGPSVLGFLGCAAVVRTRAFLQAGGFSELLHFGAEERLLALDLASRAWKLCYVEDLVVHHHPSTSRPSTAWRRRAERRNNQLITWLRLPLRQCVTQTVELTVRAVGSGQARAVLGDLLVRLPDALRRRQPVPDHVRRQMAALGEG
jgi:GT2 family glycosyltransferase